MPMSNQSKNILTAAVALLAFAAFLVLATRGNDTAAQKRLNALEASVTTTTAFRDTTSTTATTFAPATTTTSIAVTVSAVPAPAPSPATTVKRRTTATTRKPTTATTRRPTTATTAPPPAPPHNGVGQEASDNTYTFTLPSGPTSADPATSSTDPFSFTIKVTPGSGNDVHFLIVLQNNTARTISFPNGLHLVVTISQPGSPDQAYSLASSSFASMAPRERDSVTSDGLVIGAGTFTASATCDVDYGS
ncbi:MAG: hypothetical protein QOJ00_503 [Actinomycetota bacterium]